MNIEYITNNVRALINSRKQPCKMSDILRDYFELENMNLERVVQRFGFANAYNYFSMSNQFQLCTLGGSVFVYNRPNSKSSHISKLVSEQNKAKKGSAGRLTKQAPTPPVRSTRYRAPPARTSNWPQTNSSSSQYLLQQTQQNLKKLIEEQELKQKLVKSEAEKEKLRKEQIAADVERKRIELNSLNEEVKKLKKAKSELNELRLIEEKRKLLKSEAEKEKLRKEQLAAEVERKRNELNKLNKQIERLEKTKSELTLNEENLREELIENDRAELEAEKQELAKLCALKEKLYSVTLVSRDSNDNYKKNMKKLSNDDLRHRIEEKRAQEKQQQTLAQDTKSSNGNLRPILGQNTISIENIKRNSSLKIKIPTQKSTEQSHSNKMMQQAPAPTNQLQSNAESKQKQTTAPKPLQTRLPAYPSVQHRLKVRLNVNEDVREVVKPLPKTPPITNVDDAKLTISNASKIPLNNDNIQPHTHRKAYKFDFHSDPVDSIEQYCQAMGYEQPKYTISRTKQGLFLSQVIVDNSTYSTYPMEFPNEMIARRNAALKAISQINLLMSRKQLPPFPNENEFLDVLYNELIKQPNGILSNKLEDWFAEKFRYTAPKLWFQMVQKSRRFSIEQGVNESTYIILANPAVEREEINVLEILNEAPNQMKSMKLPWIKKHWNLHVTHCVTTVEIWAHLLSPECSSRLEDLTFQMESYMLRNKISPAVIANKHIYLIESRKIYHRVRVETIDKETEMALVFHIDYGNTEWLPFSVLFNCPLEFLDLPPQAVPFSLFGLDDFANFPNAAEQLKQKLLGRSFIGEVITKEAEFEANSNIQMIMFDTSTDDDVNMNDLLQEEICKFAPAPKLKEDGFSQVIVTHVDSKNGDVILQLNMDYINNTLKRIIESKFSRDQHKCTAEELSRKQLFLVHHNEEWYRAKVADEQQIQYVLKGNEKDIDVIFIDYNIKCCVNLTEIFRLESLSRALSNYPPQAIRVKLHKIPDFSHNIICRIRALLPEQCEVHVRVEIPGAVPCVTICRRIAGPAMPFCNINDDLRLEIENAKGNTQFQKSNSNGSIAAQSPDSISSPTQLFRSPALTSAPMLPLNFRELPKLKEYAPIPEIGTVFAVRVCNVSNPMSFSVQPYNSDYGKLLDMQSELQEYCDKQDAYIPTDKVENNEAYAAKNVDAYYRVIAKARYGKMINVVRCDYGDSATIRIDHLKVLPLKFRNLPIMGINARLYGIKGSANDIWSSEDVQRFRELVLNKKLSSYVKAVERSEDNSLLLTLDLVNVSGKDDVFIRDILIAEKRVLPQ